MCKVYTDVGGIKYLYHVCPPVRKIIHSLKLVDYLHVQADNPWYNYYFETLPLLLFKRVEPRCVAIQFTPAVDRRRKFKMVHFRYQDGLLFLRQAQTLLSVTVYPGAKLVCITLHIHFLCFTCCVRFRIRCFWSITRSCRFHLRA